jgi:hypothetical protein
LCTILKLICTYWALYALVWKCFVASVVLWPFLLVSSVLFGASSRIMLTSSFFQTFVILQGSCKDVESPRHKLLRVYGWLVVVWPHLMIPFWQNKCVLTIKHYLVINVSKLKFWKWRTVWFSLVGRSQIWFDILVQWHGETPIRGSACHPLPFLLSIRLNLILLVRCLRFRALAIINPFKLFGIIQTRPSHRGTGY